MSLIKRSATLAFVMAATLAASIGLSGPAAAASSPIEACGGGYHVIDSHAYGSSAVSHLMYNGSTNCVVTWDWNERPDIPASHPVQ